MITKKTALVLGAGSSIPYGFPAGQQLVDEIAEGSNIRNPLLEAGFKEDNILRFARELDGAGLGSVDVFLEHRTDFQEVGKAAIATALIPKEKTSFLFEEFRHRRRHPENAVEKGLSCNSWYHLLRQYLQAPKEQFSENHLSVVTFNYDRSFEQFLLLSIMNSYDMGPTQALELLDHIPVIHVHGSLGRLPGQKQVLGRAEIEIDYGARLTPDVIIKAASGIRIISESSAEDEEFNKARAILEDADVIYFLGFGFHPENLKRLGREWIFRDPKSLGTKEVWGTAHGLSMTNNKFARGYIGAFNPPHKKPDRLIPATCYELLHEHIPFHVE